MCLATTKKSFIYAGYTSLMSVLGGIGGFFIGYGLFNAIGLPILDFYGLKPWFDKLSQTFAEYNFWAIFTAALTPIPYKVFTITAGAVAANTSLNISFTSFFTTFLIASIIGRSLRFFGVSALIYYFGEKIKTWIEKYFNWVALALVALLIGGFALMKYVF
jgi:membrane protein YqaA with SNARE-associated domain